MDALKYTASPNFCVKHARRRCDSFIAGIAEWTESQPLKLVVEFDPILQLDHHKVQLVKPIPDTVKGDLIDCVASLRNALDHATRASAIAAGTSGKRSGFPFGDTEVNSRSRAGKGASSVEIPEHVFEKILTECKPWKDSGTPLYALNALANQQKHEEVLSIAAVTKNANLVYAEIEGSFQWPPRWDFVLNEMQLGSTLPGRPMLYQLEFVPAIHNCGEWGDWEAVVALKTMFNWANHGVKVVLASSFPELVVPRKKPS